VTQIAIIDSGGANISSVRFALQRLGYDGVLTTDRETIAQADRVILPGVGAAGDAMQRLHEHRLDELIPELSQPVLGICLGMQLLCERSQEDDTNCLGIIPCAARKFVVDKALPVPHMGWNQLQIEGSSPLLHSLPDGSYFYFVHSYAVDLSPFTLATADYGGRFSAMIHHKNFLGAQFHPERSGRSGARIIENFLRM